MNKKTNYSQRKTIGGSNRRADFVSVRPESGQSPCLRSTTQSRHVPCIMPPPWHRVFEDPIPVPSREWGRVAASNHLSQREERGLAIPATLHTVQELSPEVWEERKSLDGSQWQETHEYTAMVLPMTPDLQPIRKSGHTRHHAMGHLRGARKPEDCCLLQSPSASFIADVSNLIPGCSCQMRLKALSFECGLTEIEPAPPFAFGDDTAEPLFHEGFQRRMLLICKLAGLFQKAVRYLYGRLHMVNHIMLYGSMSSRREKGPEFALLQETIRYLYSRLYMVRHITFYMIVLQEEGGVSDKKSDQGVMGSRIRDRRCR